MRGKYVLSMCCVLILWGCTQDIQPTPIAVTNTTPSKKPDSNRVQNSHKIEKTSLQKSTKQDTQSLQKQSVPNKDEQGGKTSLIQEENSTHTVSGIDSKKVEAEQVHEEPIHGEPISDSALHSIQGDKSDEIVQEDGETYRAHITYKQGTNIRHGEVIFYYQDGAIARRGYYFNGKLEGKIEMFSQKGVLIYEAHYRAGKLHGICRIYDVSSGKLKSEMNFKNGLQDGLMSVYDSGGRLWHTLEYKQGKRDGIAREYNENGAVVRQVRYADDLEIR